MTFGFGGRRSRSSELRGDELASPKGLEPLTSWFVAKRSNPTELRGGKKWRRAGDSNPSNPA